MFERFAREARTAVAMAQEEARELRSETIRPEHILLALLAHGEDELRMLIEEAGLTRDMVLEKLEPDSEAPDAADDPLGPEDAEALRSIGIDLDAVRRSLEQSFGPDALERATSEPERRRWFQGPLTYGHIPFHLDAKKTIELALREAIARKDRTIRSAHLMLALLRAPDPVTAELLGSGGIERLRGRLHTLLDKAA